MSSTYKVPYTQIIAINPHPGADRLELATVYGFQVVVQKHKYNVGDRVIYVPVDSILPAQLENKIFPPESKIKLLKSRIRQIRIRQFPSQGMLIDPKDIGEFLPYDTCHLELEDDLSKDLGITKYEPPEADYSPKDAISRNKPKENPRFHKYNGIDNFKWYPNLFKEGEEIVVQEKLHGSNCRASIQPTVANNLWRKFLKLIRVLPQYEMCYGSNNVQLQQRILYKGYYGTDVYGAVLNKVDAFSKIKPGETIYGELIGKGIQKDYTYGHDEHHFVLFDVKATKEDGTQYYLDPDQVEAYAKERGFDFVPVLYRGPYNEMVVKSFMDGPSVYNPIEKIREGCVIKARKDYDNFGNKKVLKLISSLYLDNDNTENH